MGTMATNHVAVAMAQVETTSFTRVSHSFFSTTFFLVLVARCYFLSVNLKSSLKKRACWRCTITNILPPYGKKIYIRGEQWAGANCSREYVRLRTTLLEKKFSYQMALSPVACLICRENILKASPYRLIR